MVRAYDAAGNTSGTSTPLTFTTLSLVPTLTFFGSPTSVAYNGNSTLIWSSTDATRCLSSWGGSPGTGGIYTTPALTTNTTYAISCTGTGGTATGSVVVSVGSAPIA